MAPRRLDEAAWRGFFDRVSKVLLGKRAEIEVDSLALGAQVEAEWLPILGIAYDPKDDVIEIALDGIDHLINRPRTVYVEEGPAGLTNFEIVDGEGAQHLVLLREPLALPPPSMTSP